MRMEPRLALSNNLRRAAGPQTSKKGLTDKLLGLRGWIISGFRVIKLNELSEGRSFPSQKGKA